jgi:hypothetical protein
MILTTGRRCPPIGRENGQMASATYDLGLTEQSIVRQTDKAMMVIDRNRDVWLPKKMVTWRDHGSQFLPTIEVPLWFAKRNGLVSTARDPGH